MSCSCPVCVLAREGDELDELARRVARSVASSIRSQLGVIDLRDGIRHDEPELIG